MTVMGIVSCVCMELSKLLTVVSIKEFALTIKILLKNKQNDDNITLLV